MTFPPSLQKQSSLTSSSAASTSASNTSPMAQSHTPSAKAEPSKPTARALHLAPIASGSPSIDMESTVRIAPAPSAAAPANTLPLCLSPGKKHPKRSRKHFPSRTSSPNSTSPNSSHSSNNSSAAIPISSKSSTPCPCPASPSRQSSFNNRPTPSSPPQPANGAKWAIWPTR